MEAAAASTEIAVLGWSVALLIAQILIQAWAGMDLSPEYRMTARDEQRKSENVVAQRLDRALRNLLETYPAFIALALVLAVSGKTGGMGAAGAMTWLAARIFYVPLYASGVPVIRSIVWFVSIVGLAMMFVRLMF